jgi:2-C-methyl-D-erythritol 4-phosphate cytidylyltransferase/2-C-methyl-D-erythritol 2,4-cyclodiphosphate synthase
MTARPRIAALVVAAGTGSRAGGGLPKQYRMLAGKPVIARCLDALSQGLPDAGVWIVISADHRALLDEAFGGHPGHQVVLGGATRQASVRNGLQALRDFAPDLVFIHDAARPFVSPAILERLIAAFSDESLDGAAPGLLLVDSLKRTNGGRHVVASVPRDDLWRIQTPQAFRYPHILDAHMATEDSHDISDDFSVSQAAGGRLLLVEGAEASFKITTSDDLAKAESLILTGLGDVRTGSGFDVHAFCEGDHVMLCGVRVPHDRALDGHSDADVALHALTDALLGAVGAGDIGRHFPPSDATWRGQSSDLFLRHAVQIIARQGGAVANVDVTIICEAPRVGPHCVEMTDRVADLLGVAASRVNIKATTTERLGFTGRKEGIAAMATATIRLPTTWS